MGALVGVVVIGAGAGAPAAVGIDVLVVAIEEPHPEQKADPSANCAPQFLQKAICHLLFHVPMRLGWKFVFNRLVLFEPKGKRLYRVPGVHRCAIQNLRSVQLRNDSRKFVQFAATF
jgi:hypothetical protein